MRTELINRNTPRSRRERIIQWLREIEHRACEIYLQAASIYADDLVLKKFSGTNRKR
jgi:hypothetical protein